MVHFGVAERSGWFPLAWPNDEEWRALVREMGDPAWTRNEKFATLAARVHNQDELDRLIGEWTQDKDPFALQERLEQARGPAGACPTAEGPIQPGPPVPHMQ